MLNIPYTSSQLSWAPQMRLRSDHVWAVVANKRARIRDTKIDDGKKPPLQNAEPVLVFVAYDQKNDGMTLIIAKKRHLMRRCHV